MAVLILETGAGLPDSNSYADVAYADAYFESHPYYADAWSDITDPVVRGNLLISASRWLDVSYDWAGYPMFETQAMGWPRAGAYYRNGYMIPNNIVPKDVVDATCEQARFMSMGDPNVASASAGVEEIKVDVIELKFSGAVAVSKTNSIVSGLLRGYGEYAAGMRIRRVLVG